MKKALVLATTLAAVASGAQAEDKIKFELWNATSGQQEVALNTICEGFNKSQDNYEISCTSYKKYNKTIQAAVAAYRVKQHPAIVHVNEVSSADMVASGVMVPFKDLMEDQGYKVDWNDYIPGVKGYYSDANGNLQANPFNPSTVLLYANTSKLASVGVNEVPQTWEQVEVAMKALKSKGEDCPFGFKIEPWRHLEQISAVHNSPIATQKNGFAGSGAELSFNEGVEVQHLGNLKKWNDEGLMAMIGSMAGISLEQAFNSQRCSMVLMSSGRYGIVKSKVSDFEWAAAKLPVYEGYERHNSIIGGGALWTMKKQPENVYAGVAAFYDYLGTAENQIYFSKMTGYMPTKISTVKEIEKRDMFSESALAGIPVAFDSLNNYKSGDYNQGVRLGFYAQIRAAWKNKVEMIFDGQTDAQGAMDAAVKDGGKLLRRFEKTYGL